MSAVFIVAAVSVVVSGVVFGAIAFQLGISHRKKDAEAQIGSAEEEAKRIIEEAKQQAETTKKLSVVEARDEIHRLRNESEKELKDQRKENQRQENRLIQKEENMDRKSAELDKREQSVTDKARVVEQRLKEAEESKKKQLKTLEEISGFTTETAKDYLLNQLDGELDHEKVVRITNFETQLKDEMEQKARALISQAVSRCAADHVAEATVSVVALPNDEMKGRIIGREGRNIRTLETLTGVDLIIDDTPEAITLSSFDPVRREIARQALERLIADGRIHPARIEEMVEKATKDVEHTIKQEGERAVIETGIHAIHPDLVKLIGRLKYRTSYGQNILNHSLEVAHLCGIMAQELGIDATMARRAGLLHDIGKAIDHEVEGSHVSIGVDIAKKYKEKPEIIHAIEAHHNDVEPQTALACIVQACDAISAARPGARREDLESYIKRLERLEEIANSLEGVEKSFAIQAGREIRILVSPDQIDDDQMVLVARNVAKNIENELNYPGQIKVHVTRESRAIEFAK